MLMIKGIKRRRTIMEIILLMIKLLIMGAFMQVVASFLLTFALGFFPEISQSYEQQIGSVIDGASSMLLIVCIVAPIVEELFFRGLICGVLKLILPFGIVNIIQAAVFGIYHGNLVQGIYAFILGLFIGMLLWLTGSVLYTICFHMGINMAGMIIGSMIPDEAPMTIKVISFTISLLFIVGLLFTIKRPTDKVE